MRQYECMNVFSLSVLICSAVSLPISKAYQLLGDAVAGIACMEK